MSTCPWWCLSATRPRSPDVAARADDPPSLGVRVLSGVLFESLCTSTTTHPTVRLPPRPGGKKPLCPHTPTKREEPRDELCSSSTWPQTAPLTPRPVGRMGAVRACLKRRQSSALVYARRAEGRALPLPSARGPGPGPPPGGARGRRRRQGRARKKAPLQPRVVPSELRAGG